MKIDSILVIKHQRLLHLRSHGKVIKTYSIALGKEPVGHKEFEGDNKTPEGVYRIDKKSEISSFYKNVSISYPNEKDVETAEKMGKSPGGLIMIHGFKNDFIGDQAEGKKTDWTAGCIAVTNDEMEEIFQMVEVGIPINILP